MGSPYVTYKEVSNLLGVNFSDNIHNLSAIVGAFVLGETITGGTNLGTGVITQVGPTWLQVVLDNPSAAPIERGEAITATGGATAIVDNAGRESTPTMSVAITYCSQIGAAIDLELSLQGIDPDTIPAGDVLEWLKQTNLYGAAALAEEAMYTQRTGNESERTSSWRKEYDSRLKRIKDRPGFLKVGGEPDGGKIAYSFPSEPLMNENECI